MSPPSRDACGPCDSHPEMRALHRRDGLRRSTHFDLRRGLAPKDIQKEFARQSAESSHWLTWSNPHPLVGSSPLDLEAASRKPATQKAATAANVSPQRGIHRRREAAWPLAIGSANILVVNEELVEIRHGAHPSDAEESDRRAGPDPPDEPREVRALSQSGPAPLGEPLERTGQDKQGPATGSCSRNTRWAARS